MTKQIQKIEERSITDQVYNRVSELQVDGAIDFPANYSVGNALKSAYLVLQEIKTKDDKPVLEACTQSSIFNSLLDMVVQGLSPAKNQCYFIPYGNILTFSRSYLGTVALTKRLNGVKDVKGYPVYLNDELELGFDLITGKTTVEKFNPSTVRKANELIGALGLVIGEKGIIHVEYMDMNQIRNAWSMGTMNGNSKAHKNFPDQMAVKTVINRACKMYVNTADDSDKIASFINQSVEEVDARFEDEKMIHANQQVLKIPENSEVVDAETGEILQVNVSDKAPF